MTETNDPDKLPETDIDVLVETKATFIQRMHAEGRHQEFINAREHLRRSTPLDNRGDAWRGVYDQFPPLDGRKAILAGDPIFGGDVRPNRQGKKKEQPPPQPSLPGEPPPKRKPGRPPKPKPDPAAKAGNDAFAIDGTSTAAKSAVTATTGANGIKEYHATVPVGTPPSAVKIVGYKANDVPDGISKLAKSVPADRKASETEVARWVFENQPVAWDDLDPNGIPCRGAIGLLAYAKGGANYGSFIQQVWSKILPSKQQLLRGGGFNDDGRENLALIEQFDRELYAQDEPSAEQDPEEEVDTDGRD